ncbi:MAG: type II toxin-antitoxin system RelE/ParE family toxin [Clostridium sp.]|nr:type II toxin-antitoxin system RelE/ParE family toxin [Clostridium sp.]
MKKVRMTPIALKDLKEIKSYISEELLSEEAALRTVKQIIESYEKLAEFPLMGKKLSSVIDVDKDYRFIVAGKYIIFYKVEEEFISIYRILYGRRNYMEILFKN